MVLFVKSKDTKFIIKNVKTNHFIPKIVWIEKLKKYFRSEEEN